MLPYKSNIIKSPPRKIEIYRKKKLYQSQNIAQLLLEKGINYNKYDNKTDHLTGKPSILSLHTFDNTDYEIHSPQEWIELGKQEVIEQQQQEQPENEENEKPKEINKKSINAKYPQKH